MVKACEHQASLVAQTVKRLPAMWETWVQSLGLEDPLEKGKAKRVLRQGRRSETVGTLGEGM